MIIELGSVTRDPKLVRAAFAPGEIELDDNAKLAGTAVLAGEISKDSAGRTHLKGNLTAPVEMICGRCLEPLTKTLEIDFEDVFVDAANEPADDEIELESSDLDESLVEGGTVDLADVAREQIILETDEPAFCREDCKGLCPKCGANRNLIDCKCEDEEIDPRWAALKNLN